MKDRAGQTQTSTLSRQCRYLTVTLLSHIPGHDDGVVHSGEQTRLCLP